MIGNGTAQKKAVFIALLKANGVVTLPLFDVIDCPSFPKMAKYAWPHLILEELQSIKQEPV